ncbi:LysR family transcriptional regulator [Sulfitobacter sp. 1151]|uniref:LysR family transcriptional regulator n=1 Tax=Parasulfitobacter algicola TaxID=2614809 RepID=A0ABX2ITR2_9RHOB|nr:LysR family transcriptional regulator [Sulfitobacter algicola]
MADELHFGRAAEKLHLAQPALSTQIKLLEYDLGVALFHRTTRRVRLTAAGEAFLPEALATIARSEEAVRVARSVGETGRHILKIGGVDSATAGLLPSVVRGFRSAYPDVSLKVFEMLSGAALNMLESRSLDIAFVRKEPTESHLTSRFVLSESIIIALPAQHPKAGQEKISVSDIASEPLVIPARASRPILFDVIHSYLRSHHVEPNIRQEANERHMIIAMVASGLGVSMVPKWVSEFKRDDVVFRPFEDGGPTVDVYAVWRSDDKMQGVLDFIDHLPFVEPIE